MVLQGGSLVESLLFSSSPTQLLQRLSCPFFDPWLSSSLLQPAQSPAHPHPAPSILPGIYRSGPIPKKEEPSWTEVEAEPWSPIDFWVIDAKMLRK